MDGALKKGVGLLVVLFLGFYLFSDPQGLARVSKEGGAAIWDGLVAVFEALIRFFNAILN